MINEIMKPMGPIADLGLQRVQAPAKPGGPEVDSGALPVEQSQTPSDMDREKASKLADELTQMVQQVNRQLHFKVDDGTGKMVIQVLDKLSGDILRQIPSEEIVELQHKLAELQETGSSADASHIGMVFSSEA
jgi:flagellar protein FlaG